MIKINSKPNLTLRAIMMLSLLAFFSLASAKLAIASEGDWISKEKNISGAWKIENTNGKTTITFTDTFKTNPGPDLKVFLSRDDISSLNGNNAINSATLVSALKNNSGLQTYELPSNININDYTSLIIHCASFSVLWGGANI